MEGLRAKATRLLIEIVRLIMPHLNLDVEIRELVDVIVEAAVDEALREVAHKLATGE